MYCVLSARVCVWRGGGSGLGGRLSWTLNSVGCGPNSRRARAACPAGLGIDGAFTDQAHTLARYLKENFPRKA